MKKRISFYVTLLLVSLFGLFKTIMPTSYTLTESDMTSVLPSDCIYWEIDSVDGQICRQYDLTVTKPTEINIYYETEDLSSGSIDLTVTVWGVQ